MHFLRIAQLLLLGLFCLSHCQKPKPLPQVDPKTITSKGHPQSKDIATKDEPEEFVPDIPDGKPFTLGVIPHIQKPMTSKHGKSFIWVINRPDSIDPNLIHETVGDDIARQLFECLLSPNMKTGPPVPGVAERFDISTDGTVYTFYLRKNAKWSDGSPVTAFDFEYAWKRALEPTTGSHNAQLLWNIKGAKDYNTSKTENFTEVGIRALTDWTFQVRLLAPTPYFPHLASTAALAPVPRKVIKKYGNHWTRPQHIITNGPFTLAKYSLGDNEIVLKKSPTYWDRANVWLNEVRFLISDSETFAVDTYETGRAHFVPGIIPLNKVIAFLKEGRKDFHIDPILCIYHYSFRLDKAPFTDHRIRKAINLAIHKEKLTMLILKAGQLPAYNAIPDMFQNSTNYIPLIGNRFDPQQAKKLLAEAGYPDGKGLPSIEMTYNTHEGHRLIAEFIQRDLKENLGINITLHNMEWKSLLAKLHSGQFQMGKQSWCADYPDPLAFIELWHADNENNYANFKSNTFNTLIDAIRKTPDHAKRNLLIQKAESILNQELPTIPLYFYTRSYLLKPFVKGLLPHFMNVRLAKYFYFDN